MKGLCWISTLLALTIAKPIPFKQSHDYSDDDYFDFDSFLSGVTSSRFHSSPSPHSSSSTSPPLPLPPPPPPLPKDGPKPGIIPLTDYHDNVVAAGRSNLPARDDFKSVASQGEGKLVVAVAKSGQDKQTQSRSTTIAPWIPVNVTFLGEKLGTTTQHHGNIVQETTTPQPTSTAATNGQRKQKDITWDVLFELGQTAFQGVRDMLPSRQKISQAASNFFNKPANSGKNESSVAEELVSSFAPVLKTVVDVTTNVQKSEATKEFLKTMGKGAIDTFVGETPEERRETLMKWGQQGRDVVTKLTPIMANITSDVTNRVKNSEEGKVLGKEVFRPFVQQKVDASLLTQLVHNLLPQLNELVVNFTTQGEKRKEFGSDEQFSLQDLAPIAESAAKLASDVTTQVRESEEANEIVNTVLENFVPQIQDFISNLYQQNGTTRHVQEIDLEGVKPMARTAADFLTSMMSNLTSGESAKHNDLEIFVPLNGSAINMNNRTRDRIQNPMSQLFQNFMPIIQDLVPKKPKVSMKDSGQRYLQPPYHQNAIFGEVTTSYPMVVTAPTASTKIPEQRKTRPGGKMLDALIELGRKMMKNIRDMLPTREKISEMTSKLRGTISNMTKAAGTTKSKKVGHPQTVNPISDALTKWMTKPVVSGAVKGIFSSIIPAGNKILERLSAQPEKRTTGSLSTSSHFHANHTHGKGVNETGFEEFTHERVITLLNEAIPLLEQVVDDFAEQMYQPRLHKHARVRRKRPTSIFSKYFLYPVQSFVRELASRMTRDAMQIPGRVLKGAEAGIQMAAGKKPNVTQLDTATTTTTSTMTPIILPVGGDYDHVAPTRPPAPVVKLSWEKLFAKHWTTDAPKQPTLDSGHLDEWSDLAKYLAGGVSLLVLLVLVIAISLCCILRRKRSGSMSVFSYDYKHSDGIIVQ